MVEKVKKGKRGQQERSGWIIQAKPNCGLDQGDERRGGRNQLDLESVLLSEGGQTQRQISDDTAYGQTL